MTNPRLTAYADDSGVPYGDGTEEPQESVSSAAPMNEHPLPTIAVTGGEAVSPVSRAMAYAQDNGPVYEEAESAASVKSPQSVTSASGSSSGFIPLASTYHNPQGGDAESPTLEQVENQADYAKRTNASTIQSEGYASFAAQREALRTAAKRR